MKFDALKKELAFYADVTPATPEREFNDCVIDCVDIILSGLSDWEILYHDEIPFGEFISVLSPVFAQYVIKEAETKVHACREIMKAMHSQNSLFCTDAHFSVMVYCSRFVPKNYQFHEIASYAEDPCTESMNISADTYTITTRENPVTIFEQMTDWDYTRIYYNSNDRCMIAYARTDNEKDIAFHFTR